MVCLNLYVASTGISYTTFIKKHLSYTVWKRSHVHLLWFYRTNNNYFVNYGNHCIFQYLLAPEFLNLDYLYSQKCQMFVTDTAVQGNQVFDLFYSLRCRYTRTSEGNTEAFSSWYLWWFGGWYIFLGSFIF